MDINPEDIESMSVLKALPLPHFTVRVLQTCCAYHYQTVKRAVEVNFSPKLSTSGQRTSTVPEPVHNGYMEDQYDAAKQYIGTVFTTIPTIPGVIARRFIQYGTFF